MNNKLITHMVFGYPSIKESKNFLFTLQKYSKYIEVQFPFSDPIADGEIISNSNQIALKNGVCLNDYFEFIEKYSTRHNIIAMTYLNIVHKSGIETFFASAQKAGIYGVIIPDLPIDTLLFLKFEEVALKYGVHIILSLSPSTSLNRKKKIVNTSKGFVYAISQDMITGHVSDFGKKFQGYIQGLKKVSKIPIGVGFGISRLKDIKIVSENADYVIIGSELIRRYQKGGIKGIEEYLEDVSNTIV